MNLRLMTEADIQAAMRLKELAGWNQTVSDWERFLEASPAGCFVAELDGRVSGTATTIIYEGCFAWIGMVLVDPEHRGRGIGTRLLERAIEYLDGLAVPTIKLDATPQGKPLYSKLGFVSEYEIERWMRNMRRFSRVQPPRLQVPSGVVEGRPDLHWIIHLDHEVFGADRGDLLRSLDREAPAFTMAAPAPQEVEDDTRKEFEGYCFGRRGSRADHLGPWVASTELSAMTLLVEFLNRSHQETVFVDCMKSSPFACELVRGMGFEFSRSLTRMYRGPNLHRGAPEVVAAILGPEFG
jgi:GNAT superfamily N-acetyltransferase